MLIKLLINKVMKMFKKIIQKCIKELKPNNTIEERYQKYAYRFY